MKSKTILLFLFVSFSVYLFGQKVSPDRVEPPFWWTGMKNPNLQILVYGKNISRTTPDIDYEGVTLKDVRRTDNPNYLFLNLVLDNSLQPGTMDITFTGKDIQPLSYKYVLNERKPGSAERKGFSNSDVIYLLMPDRFSNGDTTNDNMPGMLEKADRTNKNGRHGGDIKGIANHLDYIKSMGFTGLWINPLVENNLETAVMLFERSLHYHPDHRAFWGLGLVYQHLQRFDESLAILQRGIQHHNTSLDLRMALANSLMKLNRYPEARQFLEAISDHPRAVEQLIRCCRFMGDREAEQAWIGRLNRLRQS